MKYYIPHSTVKPRQIKAYSLKNSHITYQIMTYLKPSTEKDNFSLESGIDILGVLFVRLKKNM